MTTSTKKAYFYGEYINPTVNNISGKHLRKTSFYSID
jgi:hypothetical protein